MTLEKREKMIKFWSERAKVFAADPRANTRDVWLREIEIAYVDHIIKAYRRRNIMDFGCANGYSTVRLAKANAETNFLGVDINPEMINVAATFPGAEGLSNLAFRLADIVETEVNERFDFIFTIRVFQNVESPSMQKRIFDRLHGLLGPDGMFLYVESYADGYERLNEDRLKLGLEPLPIHEHLTLLTEDFDTHVRDRMRLLRVDHLSSSYYLITRLVYSYIAKMSDERIDYDHPLHQVASMVPQIGDYGPQKACLYRRR